MKTVVVLACLALAMAETTMILSKSVYKTRTVEGNFVTKHQKILKLFWSVHPEQVDTEAEYDKIGKEWDIEAHIDDFTNKEAVEEFWGLRKTGFLPKNVPFSTFYERQREEATTQDPLYKLSTPISSS